MEYKDTAFNRQKFEALNESLCPLVPKSSQEQFERLRALQKKQQQQKARNVLRSVDFLRIPERLIELRKQRLGSLGKIVIVDHGITEVRTGWSYSSEGREPVYSPHSYPLLGYGITFSLDSDSHTPDPFYNPLLTEGQSHYLDSSNLINFDSQYNNLEFGPSGLVNVLFAHVDENGEETQDFEERVRTRFFGWKKEMYQPQITHMLYQNYKPLESISYGDFDKPKRIGIFDSRCSDILDAHLLFCANKIESVGLLPQVRVEQVRKAQEQREKRRLESEKNKIDTRSWIEKLFDGPPATYPDGTMIRDSEGKIISKRAYYSW